MIHISAWVLLFTDIGFMLSGFFFGLAYGLRLWRKAMDKTRMKNR